MMMIQNAIAKLSSELNELISLFLFSAFLTNNYLLKHFQNGVFIYNLFSRNLITYLQEQRDYNDYLLVRKNLALVSK
jgi:hypothetical protein